jgi:hypothetical protein
MKMMKAEPSVIETYRQSNVHLEASQYSSGTRSGILLFVPTTFEEFFLYQLRGNSTKSSR